MSRVDTIAELRAQTIATWLDDATLQLRLQYQLKSVNQWSGMHFASKTGRHAESQRWQAAITNAITLSLGVASTQLLLSPACGIPNARGGCTEKRQVSVQRLVPHVRRFIRDDDNLVAAEKPLYDALKRLGLLKDDSVKWVERARPAQMVSADGTFWTVITITPVVHA